MRTPRFNFIAILCCVFLRQPSALSQSPPNEDWLRSLPGWRYAWPRDHFMHPKFRTEWWYFTGNLRSADGRRFGYQLTFFRQGVRPSTAPAANSRFVVNDLKFGHFTISDLRGEQFHFVQQLSRGAYGEAGFANETNERRLAWLGNWSLEFASDGSFKIAAREKDRALDLKVVPLKPWVIHGENGISRKAEGDQHASHYYSGTRLRTMGNLNLGEQSFTVEGSSWFDHEWATNQLADNQSGWDWFSIQLEDGTELMLYRLRRRDGTADPASSGTFVEADGTARHLRLADLQLRPTQTWRSEKSGAEYPLAWEIRVPSIDLALEINTPLENQELTLNPITYWEGMIDVKGERAGQAVRGHGYLELTGYAGPIVGLSTPGP